MSMYDRYMNLAERSLQTGVALEDRARQQQMQDEAMQARRDLSERMGQMELPGPDATYADIQQQMVPFLQHDIRYGQNTMGAISPLLDLSAQRLRDEELMARESKKAQDRYLRDISLEQMRQEGKLASSVQKQREQKTAEQKKEEKELKRLKVRNWDLAGDIMPSQKEAQFLRNAQGAKNFLFKNVNKLKKLVKKYGAFEKGGVGGTEMTGLVRAIQMNLKNREFYDLGVLAGPDLGLLEQMIAPTNSFLRVFTRQASAQKQLDGIIERIANKFNAGAEARGYVRSKKYQEKRQSKLKEFQRNAVVKEKQRAEKAGASLTKDQVDQIVEMARKRFERENVE